MAATILIVDDSSSARRPLAAFLLASGFHVLQAENGLMGLELARTTRIDLMIVDVTMPVMDGVEMTGAVRKVPGHEKTPVFVLTTDSSRELVARGKAAEVSAWMLKPYKPEALLTAIRTVLARP